MRNHYYRYSLFRVAQTWTLFQLTLSETWCPSKRQNRVTSNHSQFGFNSRPDVLFCVLVNETGTPTESCGLIENPHRWAFFFRCTSTLLCIGCNPSSMHKQAASHYIQKCSKCTKCMKTNNNCCVCPLFWVVSICNLWLAVCCFLLTVMHRTAWKG